MTSLPDNLACNEAVTATRQSEAPPREDVTERKAAEAQLRSSRKRLFEIIENTPAGYFFIGEDGRFQHVNPAWLEMHGFSTAEQVIGSHFSVTQTEEGLKATEEMVARVLGGERLWSGELTRRLKDGSTAYHSFSASPVVAEGKTIGLEGFLIDITSRKQLEAQLLHSQKLEAIGQLAGGVAHDFNNILAASLLQIQLLQQKPDLPPDIAASLRDLEQGTQRAASLTRQLLLFSRRQFMQTKRVDLNVVIKGLMRMLKRLLGEHIEYLFDSGPDSVWVDADVSMLEQVVMNLCINARDAMPRGGRIQLSTRGLVLNNRDIGNRPEARAGQFACLTTTDTGCGMDQATLSRSLEPFFTTKGPGKGTGLGLATVHGIIKQHHGWIEVESAVGRGATFRVLLPVVEAPAKALPQAREAASLGGTETILVVEDEEQVRRMVTMALRLFGYQVVEAGNGSEAIQAWETNQVRVGLVFTDMVMPGGLSGLDLVERLRQIKPDLKFIISSGYAADLLHPGGTLPVGVKFLPKPYDPNSLARIVRECLDARQ